MTRYVEGREGFIGVGKQTALLTAVPSTHFMTVRPSVDYKLQEPDYNYISDGIRKNRGQQISVRGRRQAGGSIPAIMIPNELTSGIGFAYLLGNNNAVTGSAGVGFLHTFDEPTELAPYPENGFTLEKFLGGPDATLNHKFVGNFMTGAVFTFPESGECTVDYTGIGIKQELSGTLGSPTYGEDQAYEGWMVNVELGADIDNTAAIDFISGSLNIQNGVELVPDRQSATQYFSGRTLGDLMVDFDFRFSLKNDLTMYNYWLNKTRAAMKIKLTHTLLAGTDSGVHSTEFWLYEVEFKSGPPELNSANRLTMDCSVHAYRNATAGKTITIKSKNSESGVYAV